jgi:hypothetical protein
LQRRYYNLDTIYKGQEEVSIHPGEVFYPSPRMNAFIRFRERILGLLVSPDPSNVLNSTPLSPGTTPPSDLSEELKRAMDRLKGIAVDEPGRRVDYARLRASQEYKEYRQKCSALLQDYQPEKLPRIPAQRAFWINLYNALLIDSVIAFDVQRSVVEGKLGVITFFRQATYRIDGKRVSLEEIEHGILRGNRGHPLFPGLQFASDDPRMAWCLPLDPRIHFALNCGSRSCPPIQVYAADMLNAQLKLAAGNFVSATVEIDSKMKRVYLSKIFQWYQGDFGGRSGILNFLITNLPDDHRKQFLLENLGSLHFAYFRYDWGLNAK